MMLKSCLIDKWVLEKLFCRKLPAENCPPKVNCIHPPTKKNAALFQSAHTHTHIQHTNTCLVYISNLDDPEKEWWRI